MEFTLLGSAAVAVAGFWGMIRWEARRDNVAGCSLDLWDAGLTAAAIGLLVGRLVAMVLADINPLSNPGQILLVRSGVSTAGASIGAAAAFAFLARRNLVEAADAIGPSVLAGLGAWHAGCLVTDSCLGTVSNLPWAQTVSNGSVTRHPVELYAAILYIGIAFALATWKQRAHPTPGMIAGLALAATGGVRLLTEPARVSLSGGPVWLYVSAVVVGSLIAGVSLMRQRTQTGSDQT